MTYVGELVSVPRQQIIFSSGDSLTLLCHLPTMTVSPHSFQGFKSITLSCDYDMWRGGMIQSGQVLCDV